MTMLTWVKPGANGTGWYFRGSTEHVIFATRGGLGIPPHKRRRNVIEAKRGRHSAKPDEFYRMVEDLSPLPRLEMFARATRNGWDVFGDQIEERATQEVLAL
jgi:N6-adenosine-specific RNA methylase IME4